VVIVLSDHSMDWSLPLSLVNLAGRLDDDPLLAGNVRIAQNGGADLLYWVGPADQRPAATDRMRQLALATPGVLSVVDPASLQLGANAGDLVVFCKAGWRFSDPDVISNPIPGNHGHPATEPIPLVISGGHPAVRRGLVSSAPARTLDVAPTVAHLFGLGAPAGGWDGVARTEAFTGVPVGN
jgi:ectonucleotide pyrophosphatase/phosphodiesterase family protein 5